MNLFAEELKKLLIKRKLLWLFVAALIIKTGLSFAFAGQHLLFSDAGLQAKYQTCMAILEGRLTAEKERFILNEKRECDESEARLDQAFEQIAKGEVDKGQFDAILAAESEYQNGKAVVEHFYKQYEYVSKDPDRRYFVDPVGWSGLFSGSQPDYLLLISVIVLSAMVFNCETGSGMSILNLTSAGGRMKLCGIKMLIGCLSSVLLVTVFYLAEIGAEYLVNGLGGFDAPMQSVPVFGNASRSLTLLSLLAGILGLRLLGILLLVVCVFFASVRGKSMMIALISGLSIAVIPVFACGSSGLLYRLPVPAGFVIGTGFFKGTEVLQASGGNDLLAQFREVTGVYFILLVAAVILMTGALFALTAHQYVRTGTAAA